MDCILPKLTAQNGSTVAQRAYFRTRSKDALNRSKELEYGRYAIINKAEDHNGINSPKSYFQWPAYGAFLPGDLHAWKKDLNEVIELLPIARRYFIKSRLFTIRVEQERIELRKAKLKERKYLNTL